MKDSLLQYFHNNNIDPYTYSCKTCGKRLFDIDEIQEVECYEKHGKLLFYKHYKRNLYVESEHNRWLVKGRIINGKRVHRQVCWECFFQYIYNTVDVARKARKCKWYKSYLENKPLVPQPSTSPNPYFSYVFDVSEEDLVEEKKKFATASLESFIRRYGEEQGLVKYNEYRERQAYTCSYEYMKETRNMTKDEFDSYNQLRASTKQNFVKRYGKELGNKKWKEYCELESYAGCKIEYFIEKFGKEEGTKRYKELNRQKALTIDTFVRKYGEELGKEKYTEYYANIGHKAYSVVSQQLFKALDNILPIHLSSKSQYATKSGEKVILIDGKTYLPDYIIDNRIIEFNGSFWHANPKYFAENDVMQNNILAKDIWEKDKSRLAALHDAGYNVHVVWEDEYYNNPENVLEICKAFIES